MRFLLSALVLFSVQAAFAIPTASSSDCAMWAQLIRSDTEKYEKARSLEERAFYRDRIEANRARRRAGRCRGR